jgi:hypothetical protein
MLETWRSLTTNTLVSGSSISSLCFHVKLSILLLLVEYISVGEKSCTSKPYNLTTKIMMKDYGKLLVKSEHETKIRAFNETFSQLEKGESDIKSTKHMHKKVLCSWQALTQ